MLKTVPKLKETSEPTGEFKQSRLVLGTASFGLDYGATNTSGRISKKEIRAILGICRDYGIRALDTAQAYGEAEKKLGCAGVKDFAITTKVCLSSEEDANSLEKKIRRSLNHLKVNRIKNLLLHNPERLNQGDGDKIANELCRLVKKGLVEKVGMSSYQPEQAVKICARYQFKVIQLPASPIDNRLFQGKILEKLIRENIEIQIRSIFLQGLLINKPKPGRSLPNALLKSARLFREQCKKEKLSPITAALSHVLSFSKEAQILVGVTNTNEMKELVRLFPTSAPLFRYKAPDWLNEFDPRKWDKKKDNRLVK